MLLMQKNFTIFFVNWKITCTFAFVYRSAYREGSIHLIYW